MLKSSVIDIAGCLFQPFRKGDTSTLSNRVCWNISCELCSERLDIPHMCDNGFIQMSFNICFEMLPTYFVSRSSCQKTAIYQVQSYRAIPSCQERWNLLTAQLGDGLASKSLFFETWSPSEHDFEARLFWILFFFHDFPQKEYRNMYMIYMYIYIYILYVNKRVTCWSPHSPLILNNNLSPWVSTLSGDGNGSAKETERSLVVWG